MSDKNRRPVDALAMNQLLWRHKSDLAGVILRLAWKAGLKRDEIHNLLWSQVDFIGARIALPDRSVPMDENTAAALQSWQEQISAKVEPLEYVVTSPRTKERLTPTMISTTAQRAMGKAGIEGLGLERLRLDFIRRTREAQGDIRAMELSGMSLKAYRDRVAEPARETANGADAQYDERLWELLQRERDGVIAVALWLSLQANLTNRQIVSLTWDDVDLDKGTIRVGNETRYLLKEILVMLTKEKAKRTDADDPHVILSPASGKPMREKWFSRTLRDILVREGMGDVYIDKSREKSRIEQDLNQIRRFVDHNGFITVKDAVETLGIGKQVIYSRFQRLTESGELARMDKGFVPADKYIPRERWADTITKYVDEADDTTISKTAELLHTTRGKARQLLLAMEAQGTLDSGDRHRRFKKAVKSD